MEHLQPEKDPLMIASVVIVGLFLLAVLIMGIVEWTIRRGVGRWQNATEEEHRSSQQKLSKRRRLTAAVLHGVLRYTMDRQPDGWFVHISKEWPETAQNQPVAPGKHKFICAVSVNGKLLLCHLVIGPVWHPLEKEYSFNDLREQFETIAVSACSAKDGENPAYDPNPVLRDGTGFLMVSADGSWRFTQSMWYPPGPSCWVMCSDPRWRAGLLLAIEAQTGTSPESVSFVPIDESQERVYRRTALLRLIGITGEEEPLTPVI